MRIYLSSIAPQIMLNLYNIRDDLKLNVLQPFVFRNNQGIDATLWNSMKGITNSLFLDSGTFELFNRSDLYDVEECFNKYALSLDSLHGVFDLYANFDPDYKSNDRFIVNLSFQNRLGMAVFGAKNPHTQFTVAGGVTCYEALTPQRIKEFRELYKKARTFIEQVYIPDLLMVAGQYKDWAALGGTHNFMAFGEFPAAGGERDLNSRWYKPGIIYDRKIGSVQAFDPSKIEEHVRHSWYEGDKAHTPYEGETKPFFTKMGDTDRYSWLKAPRYAEKSMETGPLAQVLVAYAQNHKTIKPAVDGVLKALNVGPEALFSTLGRTAARGIQTLVIAQQTENWLNEYENNIAKDKQIVEDYAVPANAKGVGFLDAPRGGLSHWIRIEEGKIGNFQLVVPTTWNLGPRDAKGVMGAAEHALVGTPVADPKRPVEILRTIHSFDPCIACAVHVIDGETNEVHKFKVL